MIIFDSDCFSAVNLFGENGLIRNMTVSNNKD